MVAPAGPVATDMLQIASVLTDRGSRYAVTVAAARSVQDVAGVVTRLCADRKFARATHHSWGVVFSDTSTAQDDDGESGAGALIVRMLDRAGLRDRVVIVTRWYGGKPLGGDRFRHVQTCVRAGLAAFDQDQGQGGPTAAG